MSDPDDDAPAQEQQESEAAVNDVLDSALSHDREREAAIEDGNLEQIAREENDSES